MLTRLSLSFVVNIVLWYGFTILSTIYSKKYLDVIGHAHLLTLLSFVYAGVWRLFKKSKASDLISLLYNYEYFCLALFNIGTILLTNIGMSETSVSLTYMVKASEPLFVLLLSYNILGESQNWKVHATLLPICLGVTLVGDGDPTPNSIGFACAFAANICSASRIVFYKAKLKEISSSMGQEESALLTYLNVGFVSMCLCVPVYVLKIFSTLIYTLSYNEFRFWFTIQLDELFGFAAIQNLVYGSLFSFMYNLFSLRVLANVAPISHSVINIMKRVFIVLISMVSFSTPITSLQWFGMVCADIGVFMYSMLKIRCQVIKVSVSKKRKNVYTIIIVVLVVIILTSSCFIRKKNQSDRSAKRLKCLQNIKNQIITTVKDLIPRDKTTHLIDIPQHSNYGDTLIWVGEEILLKELGVNVTQRILSFDKDATKKEVLLSKISPDDTILLHGGGNFGDLYRFHSEMRNKIISLFPHNKIIIFPQTINYKNETLAQIDSQVFANASDLTIMTRSFESLSSAKRFFPRTPSLLVPDAAFMIGDVEPLSETRVDILVIRRSDKESKFILNSWYGLMRKTVGTKYTFLIQDWSNYKDVKFKTFDQLAADRLSLVKNILSSGRVIITDRLHASVMSVLLGKPHIIINDMYKKVWNTRETAFSNKTECDCQYINGYYTDTIEEAIDMAIFLLDEANAERKND